MLVNYIALLPELFLLTGILLMVPVYFFRSANTPKTFYTMSKWIILTSVVLTAVFYDRSIGRVWINNDYTTLFKIIIYLFSLAWGGLSLKRFQNRDDRSFSFYFILLLCLLGFSLALSSRLLWLSAGALTFCLLMNYPLLKIDEEEEYIPRHRQYLFFALMFSLLLWVGVWLLQRGTGSADYSEIRGFLLAAEENVPGKLQLAFVLIMVFFLFALGVAPFHFWFADAVSGTILPVAGYLSIVPGVAYFAVLLNLVLNALDPLYPWFETVMLIFGISSVFIGAVGANSEDDLRRIFAYAELYYIGVLLLSASNMQGQSLLGSLIYLLVYVLALFGIYTVFSGCRYKGEYLYRLDEVRGLSTRRPLLAAALLFFMISLIGTPPLLGFLGKLSVINSLVADGSYGLMAVVAFSVLVLVAAYLKIITAVYFEPRNISFDRVDKGVYIYMAINILLIIATILNPRYLMHDVEMMLAAII